MEYWGRGADRPRYPPTWMGPISLADEKAAAVRAACCSAGQPNIPFPLRPLYVGTDVVVRMT